MSSPTIEERVRELDKRAKELGVLSNADVLIYAGEIDRGYDDKVIDLVRERCRRDNLVFLITTLGGDPNASYRIARSLRRSYKRISAVIAGFCKSAGTLLLLGADELVMFDHAELGPLDVQLSKEDSLGERSSGLTATQGFFSLDAQVQLALKQTILILKRQLNLSAKTAGDLATRTVSHIYGGIYSQFDPLRLGEIHRAQGVAIQYGRNLIADSKIASIDSVHRLVSGYPSHGFVIDGEEAREIFDTGRVREPNPAERALEEVIHFIVREPRGSGDPWITFLNEETQDGREQEAKGEHDASSGNGNSSEAQA
jgi:SepF-like predicted cell division protein (DUF552 family)